MLLLAATPQRLTRGKVSMDVSVPRGYERQAIGMCQYVCGTRFTIAAARRGAHSFVGKTTSSCYNMSILKFGQFVASVKSTVSRWLAHRLLDK
jgi:hypothetical protein